jgi:uncharacterized iron-regulated membrane protein
MKLWLQRLHRWTGLPLGVIFLVTLISGLVIGVEEWLHQLDDFGQEYQPQSIAQQAQAIEQLIAMHGQRGQITLPSPSTPYYQLARRDEHITYDMDLNLLDHDVTDRDGIMFWFLRLHANLLLGREGLAGLSGAEWVAWVGLIAMVISLLGLYLWWPLRKTFTVKDIVPHQQKRAHLFRSHMTSGVVVLLVIILLSLTGAALTYRTIARDVLAAERNPHTNLNASPVYLKRDWELWLMAAQAQMPQGELRTVDFPRSRNGVFQSSEPGEVNPDTAISVRFVTPDDWFDIAGSRVLIDAHQSALLGAQPFSSLPVGQQLYSLVLPLHTGHGTSSTYLFVLLIFTLISIPMVFSGLWSYIKRLQNDAKKRKRKREKAAARKVLNEALS